MISRIQLLRNIGQFDSVSTGATIPLARLTLIHSENGRGKTTLAAVFRSLATGDPAPIAERRRLPGQYPPHVVLECSGGTSPAVFENNAWNRTLADIVVFDDVFVDENVYSGLAVRAHHRQNLHELILGARAVTLSRQLKELVEKIENHNRELRVKERAIPTADRGLFSVDEFCALPEQPDVDQAIYETERVLAAARRQDAICATPVIELFSLPDLDLAAIEPVLQQDLPALDAATLARVQEHLARLGQGGEAWVADGMNRIIQDNDGIVALPCPFCVQDLQSSPVVRHYRAYFSDAYAGLTSTVSEALEAVNRTQGGDVQARFERAVRIAFERRQFWSGFCEVAEYTLDTAAIVRDWRAAVEAIVRQLGIKQAAPLERIEVSAETRVLVAAYGAHREMIATINERLQETNRAIGIVKERAARANSAALAGELARLKAAKARHEPATAALCDEYLRERSAKEVTENQRDQVRTMLEEHRTRIFPAYQTAINQYLQSFYAGFMLDRVAFADTRGGATCTYNVLINNIPVPIGRSEAALRIPSFRNTLSAGDRNTLALAFFFTSLDQDRGLASKVVVIDDPISSLDEHRALTTVHVIRSITERAAQVIVLSHKKSFLCQLWEGVDSTARAALEVVRDGTGSTLRPWDITLDSITEHDRRHTRMREFLTSGAGDLREVARSIRPHLEAFLRVAWPEWFPPGTLLRTFRNLCRQRFGTTEQILDQSSTQELDEIVEYANKFHHDTNPAWKTEAINDGELRGFVQRALRFARR